MDFRVIFFPFRFCTRKTKGQGLALRALHEMHMCALSVYIQGKGTRYAYKMCSDIE